MHEKIDERLAARVIEGRTVPARRMQRLRQFVLKHPFAAFMAAATLVFGVYFGLIHPPVYVAETQFSIRGKENGAPSSMFSALIPTGGAGGISESIAVREFIHSPQMFEELDERHGLRELYARFRLDPLNRLGSDASLEDALSFYADRVKVALDREASILKVQVHSYTAPSAFNIATSIVDISEDYVNDLSERVREATLADARSEVAKAEDEVREVRLALASFRNRSGELDPAARGAASVSALIALEGNITQLRGELASQLAIRRSDAPQVQEIEARIESLERQAAVQRRELASAGQNGTLAGVLEEYEGLVIQREYAETRLTAALTALDSARQLADQRERFVVPIVAPTQPTEPTEPRRLASFLLALVLSVIAYGVVNYTIAGINDHDR
jgi:BexC/CtrB/KpsE family polysaccharide export inner-membrane protein